MEQEYYLYLNHDNLFVVLSEKEWLSVKDNGIFIQSSINKDLLEVKAIRLNKKLNLPN